MRKRTNYPAEFKTKVVLEVLAEELTVNQIATKYEVSPVVLSRWKKEFLERASDIFKKGTSSAEKELEQWRFNLEIHFSCLDIRVHYN
ncbi:Transposase [compost metagenome]